MATDNPQWYVSRPSTLYQVGSADGYDRWVTVNATFNWSAGTADITFQDQQTGKTNTTKDYQLGSTNGVSEIWISDFHSDGGYSSAWEDGQSHEHWTDDIEVYMNSNSNPEEPSLISPSNNSQVSGSSATLEVGVSDPEGDSLSVSFFNASDDVKIGNIQTGISSGSSASVEWKNLESGTQYNWYAVADDGQATNQSDTFSFSTASNAEKPEIEALSPSQNLNPDNIELEVDVQNATNVTFYDGSDTELAMKENVADGKVSYSWSGLSTDTTQSWYAVAENEAGTNTSKTLEFSTIDLQLEWNDNSDNENGFYIYSNSSGSGFQNIGEVTTNSTTIFDPQLSYGRYTCYQVTSYNEYGESSPKEDCIKP